MNPKRVQGDLKRILFSLLLLGGCNPGQDNWEVYSAGGEYDLGRIALSENCEYVYFSSPASGHGDIYRSTFDADFANNWEQVTTDENFENAPVLSLDGQTMAFCREQNGRAHVWLANLDGSDERQLTSGSVADLPLVFSPDGKYLIVGRVEWAGGKGNSVYELLLRASDGEVTYSQQGIHLETFVSADELIYTTFDDPPEIWRLNLETQETQLVVSGAEPTISPDRKLIAYAEEYTRTMVTCHIAEFEGAELAAFDSTGQMAFSGDSKSLLFVTREDPQEKLWRISVDGKQKEELFATHDRILHLATRECGFVFAVTNTSSTATLYAGGTEGNASKLGSVLSAE